MSCIRNSNNLVLQCISRFSWNQLRINWCIDVAHLLESTPIRDTPRSRALWLVVWAQCGWRPGHQRVRNMAGWRCRQLPPARYGPIIPVARPAHPRPLSGTSRMMGPSTPASASQCVGQPTSVSWVVSFEDNYALCWSFPKFIMLCFGLFWFKNPFLPCWMWHLKKMFREVGAVKMYPVDDSAIGHAKCWVSWMTMTLTLTMMIWG